MTRVRRGAADRPTVSKAVPHKLTLHRIQVSRCMKLESHLEPSGSMFLVSFFVCLYNTNRQIWVHIFLVEKKSIYMLIGNPQRNGRTELEKTSLDLEPIFGIRNIPGRPLHAWVAALHSFSRTPFSKDLFLRNSSNCSLNIGCSYLSANDEVSPVLAEQDEDDKRWEGKTSYSSFCMRMNRRS